MKCHFYMLFASLFLAISASAQIEFIPNNGQFYDFEGNTHPEILFKVEQPQGNVYFKKDGLFFQFYKSEQKSVEEFTKEELQAYERGDLGEIGSKMYYYQMNLDLVGANPLAKIEAGEHTAMVRNYYLAHCPDGITNVRASQEITYRNIYNNIDLRFYSVEGKLKYDFILHPGANPDDILMSYRGFTDMMVNEDGIKIKNPVTTYRDALPVAFTEDGREVGVELGYNPYEKVFGYSLEVDEVTETIIIDPTMEWATYFNGTTSATWTRPVFDSNNNMYNAGYTSDAAFPVLNAGAGQYFDGTKDGSNDLVIVKFNADHSQAWATYYGGDQSDYVAGYTDYGKAIAINSSNEIYVAGLVQSSTSTFPTYDPGGLAWYQDQTKIYGETSFILKFDENGVRQWASMFQHENAASTSSEAIRFNGIECDGTNLYFTGQLYNWNGSGIPLRTLAGAYNNPTYVGAQDPFIGRFNGNLELDWCTYLNGGNPLNQAYSQGVDLHSDGLGNLWFIGRESMGTAGSHYLLNPGGGAYYQSIHGGDQDLLITKFNSSLSIVWSTYYGGDGQDIPSMITTDNNNNPLIVCRSVKSTNFPTTNPGGGAYFANSLSGPTNQDSGILKFSNSGAPTWCTYIAGTGSYQTMTGIGADNTGDIYISGSTNSTDFPTMNEAGSYYDGTMGGSADAVFARFSSGGVLEWGTFYGGSGSESLYSGKGAVAPNACGSSIVAFGSSSSTDINFVDPGAGAYYQTVGSANNSFIFYFDDNNGSTSTAPSGISGSNVICDGDMTTLSVSGGILDPNDTYYWYAGSCGGTSVGTGSSISVSPTATTTYYVRAEGPCGMTTCASSTVTVNPLPMVDPVADQTLCSGEMSTAINFTGSAGASFDWTNTNPSIGLAASGSGNISSFTATNTGNTVLTATGTVVPTANGCTGAAETFTITVNPIPTVDPVTDQMTCDGDMTTAISYSGSVSGTAYSWTNDNPGIGLAASGSGDIASFTAVNATGNTEIATVTVTPQANGCTGSSETYAITVNPVFSASENVDVCAGGDYTYPDGTTEVNVTSNMSHTSNLQTVYGCDSTIVTNLNVITVNNGISSVDGITLEASAVAAQYVWVDCNNNFQAISGETGQSFTATSNGSYAVIVTENACSDTSDCFVVEKVGLEENDYFSGMNIYPNPSTGKVYIDIENNVDKIMLNITDALGKLIMTVEINDKLTQLDFTGLAKGMYHMHFSADDQSEKVIPLVIN